MSDFTQFILKKSGRRNGCFASLLYNTTNMFLLISFFNRDDLLGRHSHYETVIVRTSLYMRNCQSERTIVVS